MAITINDNLNSLSPKPLDDRYGPFTSTTLAQLVVSGTVRHTGLTLGIYSGSSVVEYWYRTGITNSDLVIKTPDIDLSGYYTILQLQTSGSSQVHWGNITNTPITLSGYGISVNDTLFDNKYVGTGTTNYILNQTATTQTASFRISGNAIINNSLLVGTTGETSGFKGTFSSGNLLVDNTTNPLLRLKTSTNYYDLEHVTSGNYFDLLYNGSTKNRFNSSGQLSLGSTTLNGWLNTAASSANIPNLYFPLGSTYTGSTNGSIWYDSTNRLRMFRSGITSDILFTYDNYLLRGSANRMVEVNQYGDISANNNIIEYQVFDDTAISGITGASYTSSTNYIASLTGLTGSSLIEAGQIYDNTGYYFTALGQNRIWRLPKSLADIENSLTTKNVIIDNTSNPALRLKSSTNYWDIQHITSGNYLDFLYNGVTKDRINTNGQLGLGTTTLNGYLNTAASTSTIANIYFTPGVAYTGSANGSIWYENTDSKLKFQKSGITADFLFTYDNFNLKGSSNRLVEANQYGDVSAVNIISELFISDLTAISGITAATYNSSNNYTVSLSGLTGTSVIESGQFYNNGDNLYFAIEDNKITRISKAGGGGSISGGTGYTATLISYIPSGGESTITNSNLTSKPLLLVNRSGIGHQIITSGTPTDTQVLFTGSTLTFSQTLDTSDYVTIIYNEINNNSGSGGSGTISNVSGGTGINVVTGSTVVVSTKNGQGIIYDSSDALTLDLESKTLVSPTISPTWIIYKNDGTTYYNPSGSTSTTLITEKGCKVNFSGTYQYPAPASTGETLPTSVSGSWGTSLPGAATPSSTLTVTGITANTSYTTTLAKPKSGLEVSGIKVVFATGNDTTSASASVSFQSKGYFGYSTGTTLTSSEIKALGNETFQTSRNRTVNSVTASSGNYTYYCYENTFGDLTNIIMNDVTSVLTAFTKLSDIVVTTDSGINITYIVYKSNATAAFSGDKLTFS